MMPKIKDILDFLLDFKVVKPYLSGKTNKISTNHCCRSLICLLHSNNSNKKNQIYIQSLLENQPSKQQYLKKISVLKHQLSTQNYNKKGDEDILNAFYSFIKLKNKNEYNFDYSDMVSFSFYLQEQSHLLGKETLKNFVYLIILSFLVFFISFLYNNLTFDTESLFIFSWILSIPAIVKKLTFYKTIQFFKEEHFSKTKDEDSFLRQIYNENDDVSKNATLNIESQNKQKNVKKVEKEFTKNSILNKLKTKNILKDDLDDENIKHIMDFNEKGEFKYIDNIEKIGREEEKIISAIFNIAFSDEQYHNAIFNSLWKLRKINNSYNILHKIIFNNKNKINDVVDKTLNKNNILILIADMNDFSNKNDLTSRLYYITQKYKEIENIILSSLNYNNLSLIYSTSITKGYIFE